MEARNCRLAQLAGFARSGYHRDAIIRGTIAEQIFAIPNKGKGVLCRQLVEDRKEWGRRGQVVRKDAGREAYRELLLVRRNCRLPA
jgi:hypothetical protein